MPEVWTIHGLWPSNKSKQNSPTYCYKNFDVQQIPQNVSLEQSWPNLNTNENNTQFWSQQWRKHGSCALNVHGVENISNYFSKAIELATSYNITEILQNNGITKGSRYKIKNVQDAMIHRTGKRPKIIMWTNTSSCAPAWLFEIRICFDKDFDVIDCPNASKTCLEIEYPDKDESESVPKTPCTNVTNSVRNNYCSTHSTIFNSSNDKMILLGLFLVVFVSISLGFIIYAYLKKRKARQRLSASSDNSRLVKSDGNDLQVYTT